MSLAQNFFYRRPPFEHLYACLSSKYLKKGVLSALIQFLYCMYDPLTLKLSHFATPFVFTIDFPCIPIKSHLIYFLQHKFSGDVGYILSTPTKQQFYSFYLQMCSMEVKLSKITPFSQHIMCLNMGSF